MIYFVQSESGPIKIGFTDRWPKRLGQLQAGTHELLTPIRLIEGDKSAEKHVHHRFSDERLRNEWFRQSDRLMDFIEGLSSVCLRASFLSKKQMSEQNPETRPETLFEIVERLGPTEVGRQLNKDHSIISRAMRGKLGVSAELVALCKEAWGDAFDEARTLMVWYELLTKPPVDDAKEGV